MASTSDEQPGIPPRPDGRAPSWAERVLESPLEWSSLDKMAAFQAMQLPFVIAYAFRVAYLRDHLDVEPYIDRGVLVWAERAALVHLFVSLLVLACWYPLHRKRRSAPGLVLAAMTYDYAYIGLVTYLCGPFTSVALAAFLTVLLGAFVFFERPITTLSVGAGCAVVLAGVVLEQLGLVPYGPVFSDIPLVDGHPPREFVLPNVAFASAFVGLAFFIASGVMVLWRRRDAEVRYMACVDDLTGLANRRHLLRRLELELERARRFGSPLAFLLIDLDHFKRLNDDHGHQLGDRVLAAVGRVLLERGIRRIDLAGRYGGEELGVILPGTDAEGAQLVAERCRSLIEALRTEDARGHVVKVTASVGCAAHPSPEAVCADDLVRRADRALYAAKADGRNCVRASTSDRGSVLATMEDDCPPDLLTPPRRRGALGRSGPSSARRRRRGSRARPPRAGARCRRRASSRRRASRRRSRRRPRGVRP